MLEGGGNIKGALIWIFESVSVIFKIKKAQLFTALVFVVLTIYRMKSLLEKRKTKSLSFVLNDGFEY